MAFVVRRTETIPEPGGEVSTSIPALGKPVPTNYFRWVRLVSRLTAAILLIPALPLMTLLIMLVHITSYGPGIYRQRRVGRNGRTFTLYKIRTMLHNAEALTGPVWSAPNDPRITPLGRLLRALHLDELPQLFNVLKGEMTLIGPRPERPEFTQHLARQIPGYMHRYGVMPGITGLAQINLPPDTDVDAVRRKLVLDLEYIGNASLKMDLRICVCTTMQIIGLPARWGTRLVKLERHPAIPDYLRPEHVLEGEPSTFCATLGSVPPSGNGAGKAGVPKTGSVPTA